MNSGKLKCRTVKIGTQPLRHPRLILSRFNIGTIDFIIFIYIIKSMIGTLEFGFHSAIQHALLLSILVDNDWTLIIRAVVTTHELMLICNY